MKNNSKVEVFVQGKFTESFDNLDDFENFKNQQFSKTSGKCISSCSGGSEGYEVFFDEVKKTSICISWRTFTGFYDANGNKIYLDSYLSNGKQNDLSLAYYDKEALVWVSFPHQEKKTGWYILIPQGYFKHYSHYVKSAEETKKLTIVK